MRKIRLRQVISLFLSLGILFCVAGCGNNTATSDNDNSHGNSAKVKFYVDGLFNFNIVRPSDMDEEQSSIVKGSVFKIARQLNNKRPNYVTDAGKIKAEMKSIYVGETNSDATKKVKEELLKVGAGYYDYIIEMVDGNIVIYSLSREGIESALNYFCKNLLVDMKSEIPENYRYFYKEAVNSKISIGGTPITDFVIQCEKYPSGMTYRGCEELQAAIKEFSGFEVPIICGESNVDYKHKILVEITGKDFDKYSITYDSGVLRIEAGQSYSANAALHNLSANILNAKSNDEDKYLNIPENYSASGTYDKDTVNTANYRLVFSDEFDGTTLDSSKWSPRQYTQLQYGRAFVPETVSVKDGNCVITSYPGTLSDGSKGYLGAEIETPNLWFTYGYMEARVKLPKGKGSWTAFWAVSKRTVEKPWSAEFDMFECFGNKQTLNFNLHSWWNAGDIVKNLPATEKQIAGGHIQHLTANYTDAFGGGVEYKLKDETEFGDDYHTIACEWTPSYVNWICDGKQICTVDLTSTLTDPVEGYKIADYALFTDGAPVMLRLANSLVRDSGNFITLLDENTPIPSNYYIDYVHLYQMDGIGHISDTFYNSYR